MTTPILFATLTEPIPGCDCNECAALEATAPKLDMTIELDCNPTAPHPDTRAGELTEMA